MGLVVQKKGSLSGGVSQQDAIHRLSTQVEEMKNVVPTLDQGTRLRNPTAPIPVYDLNGALSNVTFPTELDGAFVYDYDRGDVQGRNAALSFVITKDGGLEIIDLSLVVNINKEGEEELSGTIFKDGIGINYANDDARAYLGALEYSGQFAMVTVKDTTFVVNKTYKPEMLPTFDDDTDNPTMLQGNVTIDYNSITGLNPEVVTGSNGVFTFNAPDTVISAQSCACAGGGGGGSNISETDGRAGGGLRGAYTSATIPLEALEAVGITIGLGGSVNYDSSGNAGTATTISPISGVITLAGGAGGVGADGPHQGNGGNNITNCNGNTYRDGNRAYDDGSQFAWGGQAGWFGNGGNGGKHTTGQEGGIGAGGGGAFDVNATAGAGGRGRVQLDWEFSSSVVNDDYLREGYVWIKRIDTLDGYSYGATLQIKHSDGTLEQIISAPTGLVPDDSNAAAIALASNITTALGALGGATALGSIVRVKLSDPTDLLTEVNATDTFGDTASFGWAQSVDYQTDLPKNMAGFPAVVEVGEPRKPTYWLRYVEGSWKEYHKPLTYTQINAKTMPHVIVIKYNELTGRNEYYVEQYDWASRKIGDDETNELPSFVGSLDFPNNATIRDIFFFRNRLGFITETSIILSEVGRYGNFFLTSVAALLASDRIDATVESLNAVKLEYSVLLEDSVVLFAGKAQFRFSGGNILSPSSYKIQQESAYDVNVRVRPLFLNNSIFFVAKRGQHSAVYEMQIANNSNQNSVAFDVTAHCQTYIDGEVERLTGSATDGLLFLTSKGSFEVIPDDDGKLSQVVLLRNRVYVYKFYDNGGKREQSSWFQWTFNGDLLAGFAIAGHYYIMIDRLNALAQTEWILGSGLWVMDLPWNMNLPWIMSPDSLIRFKQFERLILQPKRENGLFLDNYNTPINGMIDLGEFVYGADGNKKIDGNLQLKTLQVFTSDESMLKLWVEDKQRNKYREVPSRVLLGRKPMLYGNSKKVTFGFKSEGVRGFRIDDVLIEANRVRRVPTK